MREVLARIADAELGRARNGADGILDLDIEPVGGERQAGDQPLRRDHGADGPGRRAFGLQILVAAHCRQDRRTQLDIVRWHARRLTIGDSRRIATRSEERREGKRVSVRVDLGGRRILKKKTNTKMYISTKHINYKR